jgi:CHAT domain-containing protein
VRVFDFDFPNRRIRGESYVAFVLPAGESDVVHLIDLGPAGPIDRLVADLRATLTARARHPDGASAVAGGRLRAAVFDPLAGALGGCRRIFLAPDGDLSRLPFEVLPLADGRLLLDEYRVSYLSAGRDVLRLRARTGRQPAEPLVVADPDFDLGAAAEASGPAPRRGFWSRLFGRPAEPVPPAAVTPAAPAAPAVGGVSRDLSRSRIHFPRLPGTNAEGERVARRLRVAPLARGEALEGRLKASRSPRIVHLATHGFFLPDQPQDLSQAGRNLESIGVGDAPGLGRLTGPGMENPMLRSGLALAGANTFLRGAALPAEAEDGLLTAEDVAGLDLLDTELVVVSACDTGLGEVHLGEGVFGLRRAFAVAGARTLVMSLWKVPDLATAFLMDRLYDNLLARGLDRDLALSDAQMATRDVTVGQLRTEWLSDANIDHLSAGDAEARRALLELARRPDGHRPFADPYHWGAFICQGDVAPLAPPGKSASAATGP